MRNFIVSRSAAIRDSWWRRTSLLSSSSKPRISLACNWSVSRASLLERAHFNLLDGTAIEPPRDARASALSPLALKPGATPGSASSETWLTETRSSSSCNCYAASPPRQAHAANHHKFRLLLNTLHVTKSLMSKLQVKKDIPAHAVSHIWNPILHPSLGCLASRDLVAAAAIPP